MIEATHEAHPRSAQNVHRMPELGAGRASAEPVIVEHHPLSVSRVVALQRVAGNSAVTGLLRPEASSPTRERISDGASHTPVLLAQRAPLPTIQRQPKTADKSVADLQPKISVLRLR